MFTESLKGFTDERGVLHPLSFDELPFTPKRMFLVSQVPAGVKRGDHAHYTTEQYLICLKGEIDVFLYDGDTTTCTTLKPMKGVYVPNLIWDSQVFKTGDDVLLVFASTDYNREDYIESTSKFEALKKIK